MSASDEIDQMHLTPDGWVQGSEKIDFAGWTHRDPPASVLLTVNFREHMSSSFSPLELTANETPHASEAEILSALEAHGTSPRPGAELYVGWPEFLKRLGLKNGN